MATTACSLFKTCEPVFISESLKVVEKYFTHYALHEQDILGPKESVEKVLALVPDDILFPRLFFDSMKEPIGKTRFIFVLSDAISLT